MRVLLVLPARYASQRLDKKMLADVCGEPLIVRTYKRVRELSDICDVVVATDHAEIAAVVRAAGGAVVMTSEQASSGTMRCAQALAALKAQGIAYDAVLNVQADELFIDVDMLRALLTDMQALDEETGILTAMQPITLLEDVQNPNIVKVVYQKNTLAKGENLHAALYFSRAPVPYARESAAAAAALAAGLYCRHIGVYGFRADTLLRIAETQTEYSPLESCEMLEQLRWLENGYRIAVFRHQAAPTQQPYAFGIDTAEDLQRARTLFSTPSPQ